MSAGTVVRVKSLKKFLTRKRVFAVAGVALLASFVPIYFTPITNTRTAEWLWAHQYPSLALLTNRYDASLAMQEGFYYFGGGTYDLDKATAAFKLAVKLEPTVLWGHYQLARIYFVQGKFDEARSEMQAELAGNPANLRALYELGLIEEAQHNYAAAVEDFKRFIAWAPTEWGGYNDGAYVLAEMGKYDESEVLVKQALQNVPDAEKNPWLLNSLGLAELNGAQYAAAVRSFEAAEQAAKSLTQEEWVAAYSSNDPAAAAASIAAFQKAIGENLAAAKLLSP
jgi:tetratricopeptide (TPR) repeat protein